MVQSDCGSSLSYSLIVTNSPPTIITTTNNGAIVPINSCYNVTISASNGCPGLAEEIGEWKQ